MFLFLLFIVYWKAFTNHWIRLKQLPYRSTHRSDFSKPSNHLDKLPIKKFKFSWKTTRKITQKILEAITKNQEKFDSLNRRWQPSFKPYLTETELVDRLLSYRVELAQGYTSLYQDFLYAIHKRNKTYFLLRKVFLTCQLFIKPLYESLKSIKNRFIIPWIILIRMDNWRV